MPFCFERIFAGCYKTGLDLAKISTRFVFVLQTLMYCVPFLAYFLCLFCRRFVFYFADDLCSLCICFVFCRRFSLFCRLNLFVCFTDLFLFVLKTFWSCFADFFVCFAEVLCLFCLFRQFSLFCRRFGTLC